MPSYYQRDENVPPVRIKHYPRRTREYEVRPPSKVTVWPTGEASPMRSGRDDDISYQELMVGSAVDADTTSQALVELHRERLAS